jgi:hypothetical protein
MVLGSLDLHIQTIDFKNDLSRALTLAIVDYYMSFGTKI